MESLNIACSGLFPREGPRRFIVTRPGDTANGGTRINILIMHQLGSGKVDSITCICLVTYS